MSGFRTIPAFVLVDADRSLGADLVISDHPDAVETDPSVYILDREYGTQIGIKLSDLRRLVLAVEKAAEDHTAANPVGRLVVGLEASHVYSIPSAAASAIARGETDNERAAREAAQEAERVARKADEEARHAEELRSVTEAEKNHARALSNPAVAAIGALTCGGIGGISERGVWRFVKDNESYSRAIKGLKLRSLVDVSYYSGGKADAHLTEAGRRIALALELLGRLDEDGDLVTAPSAVANLARAAEERAVRVHLVQS